MTGSCSGGEGTVNAVGKFTSLSFSSTVLGSGDEVKEMTLTSNCQMSFIVLLYYHQPKTSLKPLREDKADKRQNNRGQGKHPLVPFMKVGAGCLAPGAGNQCLWQTAESFTEEAMQHRATSAVPFVLGGGGRQDIPIPLNGLIRQNEY